MKRQPSPQARQRLCDLCHKTAVRHRCNDEAERALCSYAQDRFTTHLNSTGNIGENDSFVLVLEDLNNPTIMEDVLYGRGRTKHGQLLRRIAAVFCTSAVLGAILGFAMVACLMCIHVFVPKNGDLVSLYVSLSSLVGLLEVCLLWLILRYWQQRVDRGYPMWFLAWPNWGVVSVGVVALIAMFLSPQRASGPVVISALGTVWNIVLVFACTVISSVIWMWWCDRQCLCSKAVLAACGGFCVFQFGKMLAPGAVILSALTNNGAAPADYVNFFSAMVSHIVKGAVEIGASGLCAMAIYTTLAVVARRKKVN